jgi:hypothetical protein
MSPRLSGNESTDCHCMRPKKNINTFRYPGVTAGEALYFRIRNWLFSEVPSNHMLAWLDKIEFYAEDLQEFLEQSTSLWVTARLIAAGRSMQEENGNSYRNDLRPFLREYLVVSRDDLADFERLLAKAVDASLENVSSGINTFMRAWSEVHHPRCYICGINLDFTQRDKLAAFTREHIWPSSLGGNSILENLLPACGKCNGKRKMNYATWAATSIQSIHVPKKPDDEDWMNLQLSHFYAMHQFSAQAYAISNSVSLKEALLRIGPWNYPPQTRDKNDVGHFFNLQII